MLKGWHSVYNANPQMLLDRGYDKVIYISRPLIDLCDALALYVEEANTKREIIQLILKRPNFFENIKQKWLKLDRYIEDPNYLKISLDEWNNHLTLVFDDLLDFLEFPKKNRLKLVPVKFTNGERNFEGYSCSHLPRDAKVCKRVEEIRHGN